MIRPVEGEYAPYFQRYIDLVPESDVLSALDAQTGLLRAMASRVSPEQEQYAYDTGKWTVRQVMGHMCDVERVFGFRAFAFSRLDPNPLPGLNDSLYVEQGRHADVPLIELVEDFAAVRTVNLRLVRRLSDEQWSAAGVSKGNTVTVRALAFLMVGHVRHHVALLRERYGLNVD